jgi:hypothetical protein
MITDHMLISAMMDGPFMRMIKCGEARYNRRLHSFFIRPTCFGARPRTPGWVPVQFEIEGRTLWDGVSIITAFTPLPVRNLSNLAQSKIFPRDPRAKVFRARARRFTQAASRSWELRAAMSLARLWRDQGKTQQAHEVLAPVYGWFIEGFDTLDLKEAKALLDELAT